MRPTRVLALTAATAGLLPGVLSAGYAMAAPAEGGTGSPAPACARSDGKDFPIDSWVYGGPARYTPGDGWRTWNLRLRNTTGADCSAVHPVAVLTDEHRTLRPHHIQLQFQDPATGAWRSVPFESTDRDERIGVLGKEGARGGSGFAGLSVPAEGSEDLRMRMRFAADAPQERVTANITTVQRRGADGEWIGQSNDYVFTIGRAPQSAPAPKSGPVRLAETGPASVRGLGVTAGAFLLGGGVLVVGSRRFRR